MADSREVNPETPSIFIRQALTSPDPDWPWPVFMKTQSNEASAALVAEHKDRFWPDLNVDDDPEFPHVLWQAVDPETLTFYSPRGEHETRQKAVYYVYSRRKYPSGEATYWEFQSAYANMRKALLAVPETPVMVEDVLIGYITQCRTIPGDGLWRRSYKLTPQGATIAEYGLKLEITYN
jgi:hypothetical protein